MSNVPESASYDAGIYQLETVDEVLGGVNGKANAQAKGLANRTSWLKAQVDALNLLKGKGVAAFSIANSYVAGEIVDYQKNIYRANTTVTPGAWNASQWNKLLGTAAESELASVAPVMNGVAAVGVSTQLARQDHVHPADSGREPAITGDVVTKFWSGTKTWRDLATDVRAAVLTGLSLVTSTVVASTDSILVAIGKLQAQVTLRAPLASPALTGTPTAPTAADGTNTTQIASTAFVQAQLAATFPAASETVAGKVELATAAETTTGTDNTRAVHPAGLKVELDKKAPLASPALTGTPTAPTASAGTSTTQVATTAFVNAEIANDAPTKTGAGASGTWDISVTGNAATATKLATARTINGVFFDGTANITVADPTKVSLAGGNLTGDLTYQNVVPGGWARGLAAKIQSTAAFAAGIGFYGTGDSVTTAYLGFGAGFWSSGNGVRVTAAGVTISGATTFDTLITGSVNGNAATATTLTGLTPTVTELNYVDGVTSAIQTQLNTKAPLASPALTGTPTAPTAAAGTNTTQLANTEFVKAAVDAAPMLGVGQTWQNVTASRNLDVTYTNTTGKAITVIQVSEYFNNVDPLTVHVNGLLILEVDQGNGPGWKGPVTFIVPSGATYSISKPVAPNILSWLELRS